MSELTFEKGCLPYALVGLLLLKCKASIEIHCVSAVSACHREENVLAQLWNEINTGRHDLIRTSAPLLPKQVRYQTVLSCSMSRLLRRKPASIDRGIQGSL